MHPLGQLGRQGLVNCGTGIAQIGASTKMGKDDVFVFGVEQPLGQIIKMIMSAGPSAISVISFEKSALGNQDFALPDTGEVLKIPSGSITEIGNQW